MEHDHARARQLIYVRELQYSIYTVRLMFEISGVLGGFAQLSRARKSEYE